MPPLTNDSPFINQSKEDFSFAYVRAVAAAADCYVEKRERDVHGIDGTIFQYNCRGRFPALGLDFQLKCSHVPQLAGQSFVYDLPVRNYDYLRQGGPTNPAVLIVVIVPDAVEDWASHSEERLRVHRCGYWKDLRSSPSTDNKNTVAIELDRRNKFGMDDLVALMDCVTDDRF
jgi:Domain of unknown function (DUF4365)